MDHSTIRVHKAGLPIRTVRVDVTKGPDAGRSVVVESDSLTVGSANGNDLVLSDETVSRFHLALRRHQDRIRLIDQGSTNGTFVGRVRVRAAAVDIEPGSAIDLGETQLVVSDGNVVMVDHGPESLGELVGRNPKMRRIMATAKQVAPSDVPVLLLGESGTGKELLARALHDQSTRATEPFVTVDCAALSPTLFSSELFGHEKGAFTGAHRRHLGAFERAHGGTVFLDEVGELPKELQAALLGVLQRGKLRRLGGSESIAVDVRVIAATHRDLHAEVNGGQFRLDLFYRLAVVRLNLPPLRDRPNDIPLLIKHILADVDAEEMAPSLFPPEAITELKKHAWLGNVRELRNVVLGALALGESPVLPLAADTAPGDDLIEGVLHQRYRLARRTLLDEFERRYIAHILNRSGGNVREAARSASMDRKYLMELMRRHGFR